MYDFHINHVTKYYRKQMLCLKLLNEYDSIQLTQKIIPPFPTSNESNLFCPTQNLPNVIEIRRDNSVMMFLGGWRT